MSRIRPPILSKLLVLTLPIAPSFVPAVVFAATPVQIINPSTLRIPQSALPADFGAFPGGTITPSDADGPNSNVFAGENLHTRTYTQAGMQSGYAQHGTLRSGADVFWLATIYNSPNGASGMLADAVATMQGNHFTSAPCYLPDAPGCHLYIYARTGVGPQWVDFTYAVWARGNVLGEVLIPASYYTMSFHHEAIGLDLQGLLAAGETTITATVPDGTPAGAPPQAIAPTITIDAVSVLHESKGALVPTTSLHLHETGLFLATFHLSGIGVYGPNGQLTIYFPKARLTLLKGDQPLYDGKADFEQQQDGTPYFDTAGSLEDLSALGPLQARFTLILGSASDSRAITMDIVATTKKARKRRRTQMLGGPIVSIPA